MPRRTRVKVQSIFHSGQLAYFAFQRKTRQEIRRQAERADRRNALLDTRQERNLDRRQQIANHIERRIDKLEKYPSKNAAKQLQEIAKSRNTPGALRARAAAILLKWSDGDYSYGKRRRQQSRGD